MQRGAEPFPFFYKLTLSRKKGISTIAKEEEHVSIYVHLQNMRYHDSISFISDIPDELMEYQIPKLTLQPVVENAVLHGILETPTKSGTIVLTGWMEDKDVVLLISDDGVGIAPDKLPVILSGEGTSVSEEPILPSTIRTDGFRFSMEPVRTFLFQQAWIWNRSADSFSCKEGWDFRGTNKYRDEMITALGRKLPGQFFFQDSKRESLTTLSFAEYEYVYKTI